MRALVIQHQDDAPAAVLWEWARERGLELLLSRPDLGDPLPDPANVETAFLLGSDAFAIRGEQIWIDAELNWIARAARAGVPLLGICFGAQALAVALGGDRQRAPRPEIGWIEVDTRDERRVPAGPWLAWHHDTIVPPPGAEVLARNGTGVQAFARGPHLGVQFHPEVTGELVDAWTARNGRDVDALQLGRRLLAAQTADRVEASKASGRQLFDAFLERARASACGRATFAGGAA